VPITVKHSFNVAGLHTTWGNPAFIVERFVRTVRAECLDRLLTLNRRHLERVLRISLDHYNAQRPRRTLTCSRRAGEPSINAYRGGPVAATGSSASSTSTTEQPLERRYE
jgi:predicted oxidoreductase